MAHSDSHLRTAIDLALRTDVNGNELVASGSAQEEVLFLFDAHAISLARYVRSTGLDTPTTEDVVQDVFLALFRHLRIGRPRDNLRGWLFQVAHNLALKQRQKIKKRQTDCAPDATVADQLIDRAANPEQQLADEQRLRRLHSVVQALPERDRHCLFLRAEGLRYRAIAETLGISLGAVAKSLARSFMRLANVEKE